MERRETKEYMQSQYLFNAKCLCTHSTLSVSIHNTFAVTIKWAELEYHIRRPHMMKMQKNSIIFIWYDRISSIWMQYKYNDQNASKILGPIFFLQIINIKIGVQTGLVATVLS